MRPVERGSIPTQANGTPKTVSDYKNWRIDLIARLGNYCSFCEMTLNDSPQVEHVIAQDIDDTKALEWTNLLLACGACNRSKSNKPCPKTTHYLPTEHNTFLSFRLSKTTNPRQQDEPASFVIVNTQLQTHQQVKAQNTLDLCQLHSDSTAKGSELRVTDLRWRYRLEAINNAELWRKEWDDWGYNNATRFIQLMLTAAKAKGFWSAWFEIFKDVSIIRETFVKQFAGTAVNCFDSHFLPINRNPTDMTDAI